MRLGAEIEVIEKRLEMPDDERITAALAAVHDAGIGQTDPDEDDRVISRQVVIVKLPEAPSSRPPRPSECCVCEQTHPAVDPDRLRVRRHLGVLSSGQS